MATRSAEALDPASAVGATAEAFLRKAVHSMYHPPAFQAQLDEVLTLPEQDRRRLVEEFADHYRRGSHTEPVRVKLLTLVVLVGQGLDALPLEEERAARLEALSRSHTFWYADRYEALAKAEIAAGRTLAPAVIATVRRSAMNAHGDTGLVEFAGQLTGPVLNAGEEWADRAMAQERWRELLAYALTARAAKPSAAWEKGGRALLDRLGADAVREAVVGWLALVGRPRTIELVRGEYEPDVNNAFDPFNADALRGLAWLLSFLPPHPGTVRALGALVESALRKAAGIGPRNPKVANAAVNSLARMEGAAALAELARLGTRVTYKGTAKLIDAALEARAAALGLGREEIEELAVPAHGLTEVGRAEFRMGEAVALLEVRGNRAVIGWRNAAGKQVKSVPATVRRDHAEELKELKAAAKDIDKALSAQAERLDGQFLARRRWAYGQWRARYLDHPLVGTLARRLIWTVDGTAVGFADGQLRTLTGEPLARGTGEEEATVELWHPVGREPAEVVAWREWLERYAVTQPFKQAHREVYLLTDAERTTGTYSNRFAAHILRQHQFHSLAAVRGWRNRLRLCVDDCAPPAVRELPRWGLRAEYWIEGEGSEYGVDTTESGSYLRLRTDQVRFYPIDAPQNEASTYGGEYTMRLPGGREPVDPLPLAEIPALVLSEVLRDVDLFVGVASVGNDPTWSDGGPEGRFREYWASYGFGELNQSAETRRVLLERLVPRLAIADRCTVEGRFLHVRGELRTYRIHLGSGNILMTPNDQYLCIVPGGSAGTAGADPGYLPFEGDRTLAVILSKAMLLAKDTDITDPTITGQIRR
ncbi:DUF4132 domain-containing protein [Streptomyces avidinii]|uniref:DUF4132 domain-containing protein n=1 Tax=Streptomyces avidinii TaxID=1895 RepID=A0ABS4LEG7_STRAV|nr:DUF4132 domain-containing protein [Streptomyces avidinii]MBP2040443.1 hypothetical protein [Streptomyces avidinii]GGZ10466.1 hypothetical protein GCM10010343_40930 [Streptomyces avidinii]